MGVFPRCLPRLGALTVSLALAGASFSSAHAQPADAGAPLPSSTGQGRDVSSLTVPAPGVFDEKARTQLGDRFRPLRVGRSRVEPRSDDPTLELPAEPVLQRATTSTSSSSRRLRAFDLGGVTILSNRDELPPPRVRAEPPRPEPVAVRSPGETVVERLPVAPVQSVRALEPHPDSRQARPAERSGLTLLAMGLCAGLALVGGALWLKLRSAG